MANELSFVIEKLDDGSIKGGKAIKEAISDLNTGRWTVSIRKYYKQRSLGQNNFYHANFIQGQIDCFKERWGETYRHDQVHEWNKLNFWGENKIIESTGEVIKMPGSSTDNNTVEWESKMEDIRQWFRQNFEWELPFPEKQAEINY
jgi:hypothetical protein